MRCSSVKRKCIVNPLRFLFAFPPCSTHLKYQPVGMLPLLYSNVLKSTILFALFVQRENVPRWRKGCKSRGFAFQPRWSLKDRDPSFFAIYVLAASASLCCVYTAIVFASRIHCANRSIKLTAFLSLSLPISWFGQYLLRFFSRPYGIAETPDKINHQNQRPTACHHQQFFRFRHIAYEPNHSQQNRLTDRPSPQVTIPP